MKIKNGFAKRNIAGSNIVVPVGKNAGEFNAMITLNDTGSFLWDIFQKDITIDRAVELITAEYDVAPEKAREDIEKFVALLQDNNLME
ncbi:MAG: PqqD family protein [Eubacterium sp.]|nr:PqqD family protein [Eubacterium sp.]MBQ8981445.1 PqqD family protein [Eubacterium sp.]MBR2278215.1 PqqD family protein [Eubacterium sp.]